MKNKRKTTQPSYFDNITTYPKDCRPLKREMDKILADPQRRARIRKVEEYLKKHIGKFYQKNKNRNKKGRRK